MSIYSFRNAENPYIRIMTDLSKYSLDELAELRSRIDSLIRGYSDGHIYICKVRSYGRSWTDRGIKNLKSLEELCWEYSGDGGIVDVYTTNADLGEGFYNYGDTMIIKSEEDYEKWSRRETSRKLIERAEQDLIEWAEDQERPFSQRRSHFAPLYTQEQIDEMKQEFESLPTDFEAPKRYQR